jgi:hypothetical protein
MMLVLIGMTFYVGGVQIPLSFNFYSPPAVFMAPMMSEGRVFGRIVYENGTPAADITVRIFATDQLIEDYVTTDHDGYFISTKWFEAGQIVRVEFEGVELEPYQDFMDYRLDQDFLYDLGTFVIYP